MKIRFTSGEEEPSPDDWKSVYFEPGGGNSVMRHCVVEWQSVLGKPYVVERSTDLGTSPRFSVFRSNIVGQAASTSFVDETANPSVPYFYRVRIETAR